MPYFIFTLIPESVEVNDLTQKLNIIADNIIEVTGDKDFTKNINQAIKSINRLSDNANKILEDPQTACLLEDLRATIKNLLTAL